MQQFDITALITLLRDSADDGETNDPDGDMLDVPFAELGYDSLALLQVTGIIERDAGITLDDEALGEAETPRQYLEAVNRVLSARTVA
ncbi:acyl carrier protein [Streptomyces sp. NPDC000151]|uniref:acyl carrier protein n=1 Tax=Streptomyces sp. NPDC000151 TaxID=3154244 RepID=UPI00331DD3D7